MRKISNRILSLAALTLAALSPVGANAQSAMSGDAIAKNIADRADADPRKGAITFTIRNGKKTRVRTADMVRNKAQGTSRLLLVFEKPASIDGTAFLSYDHKAPTKTDETWLFLPATDRTRRVPSSDRGDSFMGTELSYGDVKDSFKFGLADYTFSAGGKTALGRTILKGTAKSEKIARETGYGGFTAEIDTSNWFPRVIRFQDPAGRKLKTISVRKVEKIGGSWTATDFSVDNHLTGRSTLVTVQGLSAASGVGNTVFDPARLDRVAGRMP